MEMIYFFIYPSTTAQYNMLYLIGFNGFMTKLNTIKYHLRSNLLFFLRPTIVSRTGTTAALSGTGVIWQVYTKLVSILSPTSVQNIIKFNWKWVFHSVILYQFQTWRKFMKNWLFLNVFCTLTSKYEIKPRQETKHQNFTEIQFPF